MANPGRKMATMRRVTDVTPIEGADRIETIHVDGWTVVDQKGKFHKGDLVVYMEPDTFLPTNDERYRFLAERGEKVMTVKGVPTVGHVLKTVRLRGQYSQGIVFRPEEVLPGKVPPHAYEQMAENKARLDGICGVCEYVPDQSTLQAGFVGKYDPYVAPRTDAERVQNVDQETFDLVKRCGYYTSIKVDGTSTTMCHDPRHNRIRIFSHNNEFDLASGTGKLVHDTAERQGLIDFCNAFPGVSLQAELCGPKIQSDRLGLGEHRLFVFSVWDMEHREYLEPFMLDGSALVVNVDKSSVPYVDENMGQRFLDQFDTPQDLLEWVDGIKGFVTKGRLDEGVVVHVIDTGDLTADEHTSLERALGPTLQMKAVSNRFLLKAKG